MCGKFAAQASWAETTRIIENETGTVLDDSDAPIGNDREVVHRVMSMIPVHVWDRETQQRRIVPMRWGFPHRSDWRRPDVIHARSETIDEKKTFRDAFLDGQRGVIFVKTFNEAPDIPGPTIQHTIMPDANMTGIAMLWRRFDVGAAIPLLACVMVTAPANTLIAGLPTDRMPAILDPADWKAWTGEEPASVDALKAMLKTVEGVNWRMSREDRDTKPRRRPTVSDPGGLF
ncbi:MAG TPA: SOS response-associated peptidase family protein [Rhizomicrobium sp.]